MKRWLVLIVACLVALGMVDSVGAEKKDLAIVIDDFGNNMGGSDKMLQLPVPLTVAVMPFMSTTKEDAERAYFLGHEVIIHMPMEPVKGKKSWLGPGAITTDLSDEEIRRRVVDAIKNVPHAVGMNHHMGSKATADRRVMRIVLEECKKYGLYYLDSKTTGKSVIPELGEELGVPVLENEIFFDHVYSLEHMKKQAMKIQQELVEEEDLIAIGHVGIAGEKMVAVLAEFIPQFKTKANIVPLSELLP